LLRLGFVGKKAEWFHILQRFNLPSAAASNFL
jgi:hypothetical protein